MVTKKAKGPKGKLSIFSKMCLMEQLVPFNIEVVTSAEISRAHLIALKSKGARRELIFLVPGDNSQKTWTILEIFDQDFCFIELTGNHGLSL